MKITEKIFLWITISSLFLTFIWYFAIGTYEQFSLIPKGKYISDSPELSWLSGVLGIFVGLVIISALAWGISLAFRLNKNN